MTEKTKPWLPIDARWWPEIANHLPRPWPQEAVYMDLRWWEDQAAQGRAKRPGRAALCQRWGWNEKRARLAMRNGSEWERASEGPARGQTRAQKGPKNAAQVSEITEPRGPTGASQGPARGQTRAPRALKQNTEQKTEQIKTLTSDSPKPAPRVGPVRRVFDQIVKLRIEAMPGARELVMTKARGQTLKARIMEHSEEEVLGVVRWWLKSQHPRAGYLREKGHGIDTLLRASNFPKYLEFSREPARAVVTPQAKQAWARTQKPSNPGKLPPPSASRAPEPPKLNAYSAEQIAAVEAEFEPLRATCKPETWERMVRTALQQQHGAA